MNLQTLLRVYLLALAFYVVNLTVGFWKGVVSLQDWQAQTLLAIGNIGTLLAPALKKSPEDLQVKQLDVEAQTATVNEK